MTTARDRFLADLEKSRHARRATMKPAPKGACLRCRRPRGWLCRMGRPCVSVPRPRATVGRSHAMRERTRRYWLQKYGVRA